MNRIIRLITSRVKRVTYFEWIALLSICFLAISVVKFFQEKSNWRLIRIEVVGRDWTNAFGTDLRAPFWLANNLAIGDTEKDASGRKIAEVIKAEKYEWLDNTNVFLTVKVRAKHNKTMDKYTYKNKPLEIGNSIELLLANTFVVGQIVDNQVPESGYETKEIVVRGRLRGREPWLIEKVKVGDEMKDFGTGKVLATILDTQIVPSTTNTLVSMQDQVMTIDKTSSKKDLIISVRMRVTKYGNLWYFAGKQKVKIGQFIHIFLPQANLEWVWIEDINETKS